MHQEAMHLGGRNRATARVVNVESIRSTEEKATGFQRPMHDGNLQLKPPNPYGDSTLRNPIHPHITLYIHNCIL